MKSIEDKFKELRRDSKKKQGKVAREASTTCATPQTKPHKPFQLPPIPDGEDEVSFERHNNVLRAEWSKADKMTMTASSLMERTFPQRRQEMMDANTDVKTTFKKYPYLQQSEQVHVQHTFRNCMHI